MVKISTQKMKRYRGRAGGPSRAGGPEQLKMFRVVEMVLSETGILLYWPETLCFHQ